MNSKRILIIALTLIMTFTSFAGILSAASVTMMGDLNDNSEIDSMDYVLLKRAYFGTYKLDEETTLCADINENGEIDSMDYVLLKRAYFGTYKLGSIEGTLPENEPTVPPLTLTQTSVITNENFTSDETFSEFLSNAQRSILVPGLKEPIVPQGIARNPQTGYIYVTAYYSDSSKASVVLVMNPDGEFVAEYFVYTADGSKYTGHMGGIAVTESYMYFSGPSVNGNYTVAEFALADLPLSGSHNITIKDTVALPVSPSHLFYDNGTLWAGNFYLEGSYDLGKLFNFKTDNTDGTSYGGYVGAFKVDETTKRLGVDSEKGYAKPVHILAVPDKVQGFSYLNGKVVLSISYGRKNNSTIGFYSIDLSNPKDTITADSVTYPMTILDSTNLIKNVTAMCMTEGMTLSKNGKLLVLFESAAQKYYNSKNPTDYIWEFAFPN